jgi:hypothetical protein
VSSAFTRYSTVIRLRGAGEEGVGEDVSYAEEAHTSLQAAGPDAAARGRLDDRVVLRPPRVARSVAGAARVRRVRPLPAWAYESAALDLALRQARVPLSEVLAREARP